jgi:hypothetical protein
MTDQEQIDWEAAAKYDQLVRSGVDPKEASRQFNANNKGRQLSNYKGPWTGGVKWSKPDKNNRAHDDWQTAYD